jgi:hypothetical protein
MASRRIDEIEDVCRRQMAQARSQAEAMAIEQEYRRYKEYYYSGPSIVGQQQSYQLGAYQQQYMQDVERAPEKPPKPLPEEHIVSTVTGFRAWNVPLFVDELRSVAKSAKWKPYERFEAVCAAPQCQGVACNCGIYAFKAMKSVQAEYKSEDRSKRYVWGECSLWGRILECKDGYRAQFGYPKSFVNNGAIAKRMAEVFGVKLL